MIPTRKIAILLLLFLRFTNYAQNSLDSSLFSIDSALVDLRVDKLNNLWYIYPNQIVRLSEDKAFSDTFNFNYSKERYTIDLKFPLKNLFYNKQKNSIELLNSRWGTMTTLKLDKVEIYQPSLVKFSSDENFWVLDITSNFLYKINEMGIKKYVKKNPFIVKNRYYFPTDLFDFKSYIIAFDINYGLFIIDDYGNLFQSIEIKSPKSFLVLKEDVYVQTNDSIIEYKFETKSKTLKYTNHYPIHPSPIISVSTLNENALIFFKNKRIYKLKNFNQLFGQ